MGQTPYHSRLTLRTEYLPTAIGITSGKGSDVMLVDFMEDFMSHLDLTNGVEVGRAAFRVGENNFSPPSHHSQEELGPRM